METAYKTILNTSPDIFLVVNSKGQIVFANAAVEKLLGYLPGVAYPT